MYRAHERWLPLIFLDQKITIMPAIAVGCIEVAGIRNSDDLTIGGRAVDIFDVSVRKVCTIAK